MRKRWVERREGVSGEEREALQFVLSLSLSESNSSGPRLLWSLYYNVELHNVDQSHASSIECPSNLYLTSEPDATIGYESAAKEV